MNIPSVATEASSGPRGGERRRGGFFVHEHDRLRLGEADLDADYTLSEQLPRLHWKLFVFLS